MPTFQFLRCGLHFYRTFPAFASPQSTFTRTRQPSPIHTHSEAAIKGDLLRETSMHTHSHTFGRAIGSRLGLSILPEADCHVDQMEAPSSLRTPIYLLSHGHPDVMMSWRSVLTVVLVYTSLYIFPIVLTQTLPDRKTTQEGWQVKIPYSGKPYI